MADPVDDQPAVPDSTNWSEWTFAQTLRAVTGDNVDLRPLSNAEWFIFNPAGVNQPGGMDEVGYQAFGIQYYGARINHTAIDAFEAAADRLDTITAELIEGRRGTADVHTLTRLHEHVLDLETFLDTSGGEFRRRAGQLESGRTDLAGTAAQLMHQTLDTYADLLELWADRLEVTPTLRLSTAVRHARDDLHTFGAESGSGWQAERQAGIRTRIRDAVAAETAAIRGHLISHGIVIGTPQFTFDQWDPTKKPGLIVTPADIDAFTTRTRAAIEAAVASYPKGDLRQAATWTRINKDITATVSGSLDNLDRVARKVIQPLHESYLALSGGLKPLGQDSNTADSGPPQADSPTPDAPPPAGPPGTPQPPPAVGAPPPAGGLAPGPGPASSAFPTGSANGGQPAPDGTGSNGNVPGPDGPPRPDPNAQLVDQPGLSSGADGQPPPAGDGQPSPAGGAALAAMPPAATLTGPAGGGRSQDPSSNSPPAGETPTRPAGPLPDGSPVGSAETLAVTDPAVPAGGPIGVSAVDAAGGAAPAAIPLASIGGSRGRNRTDTKRRRADSDGGLAVSPPADGSLTAPPGLPRDGAPVGGAGGTAPGHPVPAGGSGSSVPQGPGHLVAGGHGLPPLPDGAGPGIGGPALPAAAGSAEFGLPGWDGRVGGDGAAGLTHPAAEPPAAGPQTGYRGSGYWPTGQYGSLPTQLAGSPVPVSGGVGMPYLPGMGGARGGAPGRGRERRTWLTEDEEVWGAAPTARAGVVGPLEVDEYLDSDQLVAPGDPAATQAEEAGHVVAGHVVAGRGDDDQFEYPPRGAAAVTIRDRRDPRG